MEDVIVIGSEFWGIGETKILKNAAPTDLIFLKKTYSIVPRPLPEIRIARSP